MHLYFNQTRSLKLILALFLLSAGQAVICSAQIATPNAPDQSDMLKDSKGPEFILHNFKTMYVDTHTDLFDATRMKAALHDNPGFAALNIHIVDDRRVADVVFTVGYTFAWDFPFELRHQNTTMVLLAGKGEGPFSGPLGAIDTARVFVDLAKPWRVAKRAKEIGVASSPKNGLAPTSSDYAGGFETLVCGPVL